MALGTDCQRGEPVDPHERGSAKLPVELKSTLGQQDTPEGMTDEEAEKARLDMERCGLGIQPGARG